MIWHSANITEITEELNVNIQTGLSNAIAHIRLKDMGENFSSTTETESFAQRLVSQLKHPIIILMLIASAVSLLVEWLQPADSAFDIFATPLICIIITVFTILLSAGRDWFCEQYIEDAGKQIMPHATVIRAGKKKVINATDVVQGDIILLSEGDCIPADARIISAENLSCNEYVLSGESSPVVKDAEFSAIDITPIAERANMVFSGCWVTHGSAVAVVVETGINTEAGKIAHINRQPVLKKIKSNVNSVAKSTATVIPFVMVALYIIFFLIVRLSPTNSNITNLTIASRDLLLISALAFASLPIFIKSIASVSSAIGLSRLYDKGIKIIDSDCIHTLGRINHVCIDKAALTVGDMHAVEYYNGNSIIEISDDANPETAMLLKLASACSSTKKDQTDAALIDACINYAHISKKEIDNLYPKLSGTPFNYETMMSVSVNMIDGEPYAIIKGAVEAIVPRCECNAEDLYSQASQMGAKSLHVIAIAIKKLNSVSETANAAGDVLESGFSLLGLIGLSDPLKPDSLAAIKELRDAGVDILMMTGDSIETASSVAHRMGILNECDTILTGKDIDTMSEYELADALKNCTVIARITPTQRVKVISSLQNYKIVAVNGRTSADSVAIKTADVGCAAEKFGTDVAKYSADVVLADDGIDSMLRMIKGGRNIMQSIRRSVHSTLVAEFSMIAAILLGYILFGTSIMNAAQILYCALAVSVIPTIILSCEKYATLKNLDDKELYDSCFDRGRRIDIVWHSALICIIALISFVIANTMSGSKLIAMSAAMITFVSANLLLSGSLRSRRSVFKVGLFSNPVLIIAVVLTAALTIHLAISVFAQATIAVNVIVISVLLSVIPLILGEIGKVLKANIISRRDSK